MASSIAVMPKLQMSALKSYPDCLITSGDIQYGVPTNVFCQREMWGSQEINTWPFRVPEQRRQTGVLTFLVIVAVSWPDTPKSASLTGRELKDKLDRG